MKAVASSVLLYTLYIGPLAILPLALDGFFLWSLLTQHWSAALLRG